MKSGTRIRILTITLSGERDWSETGRIGRWHPSFAPNKRPDGYFPVTFDSDGARLLIPRERLMICNDQRG